MSFDATKITKTNVLEAARKIGKKKLRLRPSTGYDVIIEGKRYPPKEIIRISYKLATKKEVGLLYGGDQVNKPLRDLGFEVSQKISIWKLGCNWGKGAPSFYEFIKKKKIILGTNQYKYKVGDLIVITEGFTVYAIARIKEPMQPITSNNKFKSFCDEFKVDFDAFVTFSKAEWYVLQDTEVFIYQLQQGIRNIRDRIIIDKVIDLWDNKKKKISPLSFYSKHKNEAASIEWTFPCFILNNVSWNDFGLQTTFELFLYKTPQIKIQIGTVKILQRGNKETLIPSKFISLDDKFCSLGQTIEYYKRLRSEVPSHFLKLLRALNDCAFSSRIRKRFENETGFHGSLLRSSEAELALKQAKSIIGGQSRLNGYKFTFRYRLDGALDDHIVDFSFNKERPLNNRFFCLVGKNGTGKTKFVSQLANKLTNDNEPGNFEIERPTFSKIIATSFSYFDNFRFPEKEDISYEFIGIKGRDGLLSEDDSFNLVWTAFGKLSNDKMKKTLWAKCISTALEMKYLDFTLDELLNVSKRNDFRKKTSDIFSSGQKIIFYFITRLISSIEPNSLVIFDEPETHLHPNIAGRLLRTLNKILEKCHSFCIISTHSPIIVQEIPSRYTRIFERKENHPIIYQPAIECFGENLSNISNAVFHADEEKEIYKSVFEKLIKSKSIEQINQIFENQLSLNASLFIQSLKNLK